MNYLKTFYPQSETFQASFHYKTPSPSSNISFGLTGNSGINFTFTSGLLKINNKVCSSLNERDSLSIAVCGKMDELSIWDDNTLIDHIYTTGFNFYSIFATYNDGDVFDSTISISKPDLSYSFAPWSNGAVTGYLTVTNLGKNTIKLNSLLIENNHIDTIFTGGYIAPSGGLQIPLIYKSKSNFSGIGSFLLNTDAGDYSFNNDFVLDVDNSFRSLSVSIENNIFYPSGKTDYFIKNNGSLPLDLNLMFNVFERDPLIIKTGSGMYFDGGIINVNYLDGGFYKRVGGACGFNTFVNEIIDGRKTFQVSYTGNFTGVGGRLNATGIQSISGTSNVSIFTTGELIYNYAIPVSSIILGNLAFATAMGSLTGIVGTGSGQYHFLENITQSGISYAKLLNGLVIYPPASSIFTGTVNSNVTLKKLVTGNVPYFAYEDVYVYEGTGNPLDLWNIDYYDAPNTTLINFKASNLMNSSGFGDSGIKYNIPSGATHSGQIRFFSNYDTNIFQSLYFKLSDPITSINKSLYFHVE